MSTATRLLPPPLREGDRLTRDEFLRRWEAMPDLKFAELIDGVVYMASPLTIAHGEIDALITIWLGHYAAYTLGCRVGNNLTWLMEQDAPQPDIALRIAPEYQGQSRVEGKYAAGAPELIVEVSASSSSRDLGSKLRLYQRAGVREYITVLVNKREILWRELVEGSYRRIEPDADGLFRSRVLPGLWLDPAAVWGDDLAGLLERLGRGIQSPEHMDFVRLLAGRKRS